MTRSHRTTHSEAETAAVGRELATGLDRGSVVLLYGDLGAGKTAFVRGMAEGLGADPADVSSPTFTLVQEYRAGRLLFVHADLYRLDGSREIDDLGLEEIGGDGVVAIEWAEKLPRRPPGAAVEVHIRYGEGDIREITINRE